jgi:predicted HTH transcriptional regulator
LKSGILATSRPPSPRKACAFRTPPFPRNPLIAEPLFLTRYTERAGSGTLDMIARCRDAGLPKPDFDLRSGQFVITVSRGWLTGTEVAAMGPNERQKQALTLLMTFSPTTTRLPSFFRWR